MNSIPHTDEELIRNSTDFPQDNPAYERIMITMTFNCGHEGIIPVFRMYAHEYPTRRAQTYKLCKGCQAKEAAKG